MTSKTSLPSSDSDILIGIDPGLSGAIVMFISAPPYPILKTARIDLRGTRARDLVPGLIEFLHSAGMAPDLPVATAVLEDATAFPGQSLSTASRFAIIRGALQTIFHPVIPVSPRVWKRKFGLSPNKRESIALARPYLGPLLLKDHDIAEAFLIAFSTLLPPSRPSPFQ